MKSLQRWILAGLFLGVISGLAANLFVGEGAPGAPSRASLDFAVREFIEPLGKVFLRLLFLTVLPLVFSSLVLGVHELKDMRALGKIGLKTLVFALILTGVSVGVGLALVNWLEPGKRLDDDARRDLISIAKGKDRTLLDGAEGAGKAPWLERTVNAIIPRNPVEAAARAFDGDMVAVMFFALLFGIALGASKSGRTAPVLAFLEGLQDISMWLIGFAMKLAPLGVAALVFSVTSRLGISVVVTLGAYVLTVLAGLGIQQFVVYPAVLRLACGLSPRLFFRRIRLVMVTAFSTSSSNATLPTTIQVARTRLGISSRIANFVLTLGSSFNQNGTALFEGVTVIFIAQAYGVHLAPEEQLVVLGMSVLAGIGTAGVPGGSIPLIVPVLVSVRVPAEGIAIILGVDRFLDMCRTTLNVTGDLVVAAFVARSEGELRVPQESTENGLDSRTAFQEEGDRHDEGNHPQGNAR